MKANLKTNEMKMSLIVKVAISLITLANVFESKAAENTSTASIGGQMKIVPSVGYTYFNITGSEDNFQSKGGNSAAVLVNYSLTPGVDLESGLEYLETGARMSLDLGILSLEMLKLDMQQLAVPLRAKYTFNHGTDQTQFYAKGGITPTYLMSAKVSTLGAEGESVKSNLNEWGALAQAALGLDWAHESLPGRISFDLIYSSGVTKVFKEGEGRQSGFQAQLGYVVSL